MANWAEIRNKIVLEGEAGYKKNLAEINRALRESKSEMKALSAEYADNDNSAQALSAKIGALEDVEQGQILALETMREHLAKVADKYGENSREATELRTKINNARAEMAKTGNELRELRSRLDQAAGAMEDAEQAADGVGEDLKEIGDGAGESEKEVSKLADVLKDLTGLDVGDLITGASVGAAAGAAVGALKVGEDVLDSWNQLQAYTGATEEEMVQLKADAQAVADTGIGGELSNVTQAVATVYQQTGLTGTSLQDCTKYAIALSDTFGMDVGESARTAAQLMDTFGISGKEAYDLIVTGAQNGADKNGNLLDTINEYAPYFKGAGKEADEMFAAIISGAQNGVYDVDKIGDSWKEFMLRLTSDDEGAKQALNDLGFAADDVKNKIAAGGPAADLATQQIIEALAGMEDPYQQNLTATALFGTQWEDVSGKVLPAFENIEGGLDDVAGAAQSLVDIKYDDLSTSWDALKNKLAALAEPALLAGVNAANEALNRMGQAVTLYASGDFNAGLSALAGPTEESEEVAKQYAVAEEASKGLREELDLLNDQIREADRAGDTLTAARLVEQRAALLEEIAKTEVEAVEAMEAAAETAVDAAAETLEESVPDIEAAGESLGESTVLGYETGAEGMEQAGRDAAAGAERGAKSASGALYSAGAELGGAFRRGFRNEMMIQSPSRAAMEDMAFVTEGYVQQSTRDRQRLQEAGVALADALRGGFGAGTVGGNGVAEGVFSAAGGVLTAEAIAQATAQAISGMGLYVDGNRAGEILEPGVSRTTSRRAMGTVRGQSAKVKGW